jgi:hypothetical protein
VQHHSDRACRRELQLGSELISRGREAKARGKRLHRIELLGQPCSSALHPFLCCYQSTLQIGERPAPPGAMVRGMGRWPDAVLFGADLPFDMADLSVLPRIASAEVAEKALGGNALRAYKLSAPDATW